MLGVENDRRSNLGLAGKISNEAVFSGLVGLNGITADSVKKAEKSIVAE